MVAFLFSFGAIKIEPCAHYTYIYDKAIINAWSLWLMACIIIIIIIIRLIFWNEIGFWMHFEIDEQTNRI